jgi:two-component system LytT family sensor kinase
MLISADARLASDPEGAYSKGRQMLENMKMFRSEDDKALASGRAHPSGVSLVRIFALWTGIGLLFAMSWYMPSAMEGRAIPFRTAATWYLLDCYVWFALTPLVVLLQRRLHIDVSRNRGYVWHVLLALCFSWIHFVVFIALDRVVDPNFSARFHSMRSAITQLFLFRTISGSVTYTVIVAIASARHYYQGLRSEREHTSTVECQLATAKLTALRMQLHPHFLFNALHSVGALIEEQPREATRMVARIGDFLRLTLEGPVTQFVTLQEEARFLELYFKIEEVRVGDRVRFLLEIDPLTTSTMVPNLILQPLVENALRHGAFQSAEHTRVIVRSRWVDHAVEIMVSNESQHGPVGGPAPVREGVGLSNVRSRLEQMYPGRFRFEYGWISASLFRVLLILPTDAGLATT